MKPDRLFLRSLLLAAALTPLLTLAPATARADRPSFAQVVATVQPKIVKIYGAGGIRGLEAYQSGFLISANGHILTVWSHVLDTDVISVTLDDGRKFEAEFTGADPRLGIAVLKVPAEDLDHFSLDESVALEAGDRVLTFSNLFGVATGDESASVLHGSVSVKSSLQARQGAFETNYKGQVYILDAITNNPGAAGGVLTDQQGRFAGLLGKELKNALNNTWLNYALPTAEFATAVEDILAGKSRPRSEMEDIVRPEQPHTLAALGIVLVPDVLPKTPPFVDRIREESLAEMAGLQPDDLILFVNDRIAASCKTLRSELELIDRIDKVRLTVQRDQQLLELTITPSP